MSRVAALTSTLESGSHIRLIWLVAISEWLLTTSLAHLSSVLALFDSSPRTLSTSSLAWLNVLVHPSLRWDNFHFTHIARNGYMYEHEWAFFPGSPFVMWMAARVLNLVAPTNPGVDGLLSYNRLLLGGMLAVVFCNSATTLYRLTLHHMRSPHVALLASLLSLLPSSPATLNLTPYPEPFFTFLSHRGMLYCAREQWILATCAFALASAFRSNGILLAGFIIWGMLVEPFLTRRKITVGRLAYSVLLTSTIFIPFVSHQYSAYYAFCVLAATPAPWCSRFLPSVYSYVQAKYWGVGFLRYWTIQQLPNFVIAAPPLFLLLSYSAYYLRCAPFPRLCASLLSPMSNEDVSATSPFLSPALAPHAIHALVFTCTILFAAHTQIILRLAASMPFTYWAGAWLLVEHRRWGKCWIWWSVVWGAVSVVLWATFLPPA